MEQQNGYLQRLDQGPIADFTNNLLRLANVLATDRRASVPRWRRQLRWLLDFSSKRQKERQRVQLPCSHSFPLSPYSSFHLPLCGRWLREKQAILTEHSENNQSSRKWAINIKIPSSAAPGKRDSAAKLCWLAPQVEVSMCVYACLQKNVHYLSCCIDESTLL